MKINFLFSKKIWKLLFLIDKEANVKEKAKGCRCGGRLDSCNYQRKPRGIPLHLVEEAFFIFFSLCCSTCRKRTRPPSVRFLGRKVYWGPIFVLAAVLLEKGKSPKKLFGMSNPTLKRWRLYWKEGFSKTDFWKEKKSFFKEPIECCCFATGLFHYYFLQEIKEKTKRALTALLEFLSPLSWQQLLLNV